MKQSVHVKTIEAYGDRGYFDKTINEWLERNKDKIDVINISTSSRNSTAIIYMATIVYKGDAQ